MKVEEKKSYNRFAKRVWANIYENLKFSRYVKNKFQTLDLWGAMENE